MKEYIAIEWRNGKPYTLHSIQVPDVGEMGFYRQGVSLSRFAERETKELARRMHGGKPYDHRRFSVRYGEEWREEQTHSDASLKRITGRWWVNEYLALPRQDHLNVWSFYESIGYDHKKQKFSQMTPVEKPDLNRPLPPKNE